MSTLPEPFTELIREEIESPGSIENVLRRVEGECGENVPLVPLMRFLSLKDKHHRHSYYVKMEHVFFRRLGWRLMRPLFFLGIVAAVISIFLQDKVDPIIPLSLFLGGAASFYVLLQFFIHRWAWKDYKRLVSIEAEYQENLRELLEEK